MKNEEKLKVLIRALHEIACWDEDPHEVTGSFDEPGAAKKAREALSQIGIEGESDVERRARQLDKEIGETEERLTRLREQRGILRG